MAELDEENHRLLVKLVYYGPAMSGKTTNLMGLHNALLSGEKGELMALETKNDRTLFFDLLPLGFRTASGLLVKVKLFTVPGQVQHDSTRKAVLSRADGVVFVADSQRNQGVNNGESFQNLAENAQRVGIDFEKLPLVVQYNKRDLPEILGEEEIHATWREAPWPVTLATAALGLGVVETFRTLVEQVFPHLDHAFELTRLHGMDREQFLAGLCGPVPPT